MNDDPMLPQAVAGALGEYRAALAEHGMTWGEPPIDYVRAMSPSRFVGDEAFFRAAYARVRAEHPDGTDAEHEVLARELDFDEVLRDALGGEPPPEGLAVLRLTAEGHRLDVRPRTVLEPDGGAPAPLTLLIDNGRATAAEVGVGGRAYRVAAGGAHLVEMDTSTEVTAGPERVELSGLTRIAPCRRVLAVEDTSTTGGSVL
ncbi:hypothetical protein AB0B89_35385, partial [Sphaerisporangium sp. NPDC049002]